MTNAQLYGYLPPLSTGIRRRQLQLAGHCKRAVHQPVSKLVLRKPPRGIPGWGRKADLLTRDVGLGVESAKSPQ